MATGLHILVRPLAIAMIAGAASAHAFDRISERRMMQDAQAAPVAPAAVPAMDRRTLVDLLVQLESLQTELRQLRNQVELQTNEIERLKSRLQDLVRDLDRRVGEIERRGVASSAPRPDAVIPRVPPLSPVAAPPPAAPPPPAAGQEQRDYDAAFNMLKQGYYERAAKAFHGFLDKHPQSTLADNAQYWIGEANYVMRNFKLALEEFSKVEKNYPSSVKVRDALLKIGYSYYELGEWDKARQTLTDVIDRFPNTVVAKSAEGYLAKLQKRGQ